MEKTIWTVTNIGEDQRQFTDRQAGTVVVLNPRESVVTTCPPEESVHFKVEKVGEEKQEKKSKKNKMESE